MHFLRAFEPAGNVALVCPLHMPGGVLRCLPRPMSQVSCEAAKVIAVVHADLHAARLHHVRAWYTGQ